MKKAVCQLDILENGFRKEKKKKKEKRKKKEKKSENKQGFKKIVHRVYYLLLFAMKRFASLSHILLREEP